MADITSNLVLRYSFDLNQGAGATVNDDSGNANTGTTSGTPTWVQGKIGAYAMQFVAASSQYVHANDSATIKQPTTAITMCAWIKPDGNEQANGAILAKNNSTSLPFNSYAIGNAGVASSMRYFTTIAVAGQFYTSSLTANATTAVSAGTWYFIASTWSSGAGITTTIYNADGSVNSTITGVFQSNANSDLITLTGTIDYTTLELRIGRNEGTSYFGGQIDEARVYSRVLSAADIQALIFFTANTSNKSVNGGTIIRPHAFSPGLAR